MDSLGLILFIVLMVLSFLSKKKPKQLPPDYGEQDEYSEYEKFPTKTQPSPRKWDIPGPSAPGEIVIEQLPPREEEKTPFIFKEPAVASKGFTSRTMTNFPPKGKIDQRESKPKAGVNWQQAMVLSQILAEPKGKQLVRRYSRIK